MIENNPMFQEQFECINSSILRKIVQNLQIKLFSKGQMMFSKCDKADFAYLVLEGEIGFYQHDFKHCKTHLYLKRKALQSEESSIGATMT